MDILIDVVFAAALVGVIITVLVWMRSGNDWDDQDSDTDKRDGS